MPDRDQPQSPSPTTPQAAAQHISEAHGLLKTLRDKVGSHPELDEAIRKLEHALDTLTTSSGGLL